MKYAILKIIKRCGCMITCEKPEGGEIKGFVRDLPTNVDSVFVGYYPEAAYATYAERGDIAEQWETLKKEKIAEGWVYFCDHPTKIKQMRSEYLIPPHKGFLTMTGHPEGTLRMSNRWTFLSKNITDFVQCHLYNTVLKQNTYSAFMKFCIAECRNNIYYPIEKR